MENKEKLIKTFDSEGIQIRPLICGSMVTQPFYKNNGFPAAFCPNASIVDEYGVYIPNHPHLSTTDLRKIVNCVNKSI